MHMWPFRMDNLEAINKIYCTNKVTLIKKVFLFIVKLCSVARLANAIVILDVGRFLYDPVLSDCMTLYSVIF